MSAKPILVRLRPRFRGRQKRHCFLLCLATPGPVAVPVVIVRGLADILRRDKMSARPVSGLASALRKSPRFLIARPIILGAGSIGVFVQLDVMALTGGSAVKSFSFIVNALIIFVIVIATLYFAREVLIPVALAGILSFMLAPPVRMLQNLRFPRGFAVMAVVLLAFGAIFALGGVMAPS